LIFQSQKKWTLNGTTRVTPVEKTLMNVSEISRKIGLTRIADITYMDKLYIPNYSCVLPGTEDYIWVYSGKGPTKKHAKVSAIMESIERYSALPTNYSRKFITGTFNQLKHSYNLLHPDEVVEPLTFDFQNDMVMDYVEGYDIINKENILVPAALALFRYTPTSPSLNPFAFHHTNGLASGNVVEEAVCHALCEVIERDAISLSQLRASAIPFHILYKIYSNLRIQGYHINTISKEQFMDDNSLYPDVKISEDNFLPVTKLINKFKKFNIKLMIKDITTNIKIPTFNVACVEWISHDYGYLAEGHGTHPDKRIAILRAITEVSQTRAANIQGARDDLRKIHYKDNNTDDKNAWQFMSSQKITNFSDIITYQNEDILDDINLIIKFFKEVGLNKAIIVNLTNPKINVPVVRAIVPGLETFKISRSVMGFRARRSFK
jgi:ribosomal protein S12 methylthiotransferase accessory factor YcaO